MKTGKSVLIVAPVPPPFGGMALQAQLLLRCLRNEGVSVHLLATNPTIFGTLQRVKGLRTVVQLFVFLGLLVWKLPGTDVLHILAASNLYFFLRVIPSAFLGRFFGARVVINYRGGMAPKFFSHWTSVVKATFRVAHATTVPSLFLKRVFAEYGFSPSVVPNLVDLDHFERTQEGASAASWRPTRTASAPRLLVTRNFEPIYDVKTALQAFRLVKKKYPQARMDLVGAGSQEQELKQWIAESAVRDVIFHGAVPNHRIPAFLQHADVLVNPSLADNMPINLLEAFAAGVPVVSTRVGGIPDLVGDEKAALLVDPGDYQAMAEKIISLLATPEAAARLTGYAKELCKQFTWGAVRGALFAVYFPAGQNFPPQGLVEGNDR